MLLGGLVTGGVLVARTFVEATPTKAGAGRATVPGSAAPRRAESIEAAIEAAAQYSRDREYAKAEAVLMKAAEQYPGDQPLRLEYARVLVAQQKFAQAYPEYVAAISLERSSSTEARGAASDGGTSERPANSGKEVGAAARALGDPSLHFEAGTIASKAGLLDRAEEHYSMAQSGDAADPRYPLFLGMVQLRLNKVDAAQASLVRAVTLDPAQSAAWGTLAELSLQKNQVGLALQHIEKARAIDANTPRWRIVQAKTLKRRHEKGDVEMAAQLLLAMDRSELVKPEAAATLAECYGLLSRPADAAALYEEAYRADRTNAGVALSAAKWFQRAGNAEKSLHYAKTAAMLGDESGAALVKELESAARSAANVEGAREK